MLHDASNVWDEAQIKHMVCFIENDSSSVAESEVPVSEVIEQTTRCRNNDVTATGQLSNLGEGLHTTNHHSHRNTHMFAVFPNILGDLRDKLSGGCQNQGVACFWRRAFVFARELVEYRQHEGRRFARSGLSDAKHVLP